MKTQAAIKVSPIDMKERKKLDLRAGDTVKVSQKIQEKGKTRIQIFEGLVLARKHGAEAGATFTVRKVSAGYGIERIFPMYSPLIDKIEVVRRAKVRRAKLYYVRTKVAKEINRQMRNSRIIKPGEPDAEVEADVIDEAPEEVVAEEVVEAKAE